MSFMRSFLVFWLPLLVQDLPGKTKSAPLRFQESDGLLRKFETPETEFDFAVNETAVDKKFKTYDLRFPSAIRTDLDANNTVPGKIWIPAGEKPAPALVLVHFIGGNHDVLETVGIALARRGIGALYFKLPYYGDRGGGQGRRGLARAASAQDVLAFFHQAVADVRRARDVLASMPGIDGARVGVLGVSLGAVIAATTAGVDPTFPYVILVVGGADLGKIIFHGSDETRFMVEKLAKEGLDEAKTREFFKEVDPATHASRIGTDRCLLFSMKHDEVFPKESVDALADRIGKPAHVWYDGKHAWIAIYLMAIVDETKKFILR